MEQFQVLLEKLFYGTPQDIKKILHDISPDKRKQLYKEFKEIIKTLRKSLKQNFENGYVTEGTLFNTKYIAKYKDVKDLYKIIKNNLDNFSQIFEENKICINPSVGAYELFLNLQIISVGLSDKKSILASFKCSNNDPYGMNAYNKHNEENSFIPLIGTTLLDRNEEWSKEVFIKFFQNVEIYVRRFTHKGILYLISEIIEKYPDWEDDFFQYVGKAMYLDDFHIDIKKYSSKFIMTGIKYEPENESNIDVYNLPISKYIKTINHLIETKYLPRKELIKIALNKLLISRRQGLVKLWIDFYEKLKITKDDLFKNKDIYVDLINAPSSLSMQIGLDAVKTLIKNDQLKNKEDALISLLSYNLNNPIQKVVKESLSIIKLIAEKDNSLNSLVLEELVNNITTPHKAVRIDIIKWINKNIKEEIPDHITEALKEVYELDEVTSVEKEMLKELFFIKNINIPKKIDNEFAEIIEKPSLKELVETAKDYTEDLIYSTNITQISKILEKFSQTRKLDEQKILSYDSSYYIYDEKFYVTENIDDFIEFVVGKMGRLYTDIDFELFLSGFVKFKSYQHKYRFTEHFAPLLKKLNEWNSVGDDWVVNSYFNDIFLGLIVYSWLNNGKEFEFDKNSRAIKFNWSNYINELLYKKLLFAIKLLQLEEDYRLLSTPSYETGWIAPEALTYRLIKYPKELINIDDLLLALLRFPNTEQTRSKVWSIINYKIKNLDEPIECAIAIAFAPNELMNKAVDYFCKYFDKKTPTDVILENYHYYETRGNHKISDENIKFRLFNSALRSRFGLKNLLEELPNLKQLNLKKLRITSVTNKFTNNLKPTSIFENISLENLISNIDKFLIFNRGNTKKLEKYNEISELLLYPKPIGKNFRETELGSFLINFSEDQIIYYPQFLPYVITSNYSQPFFSSLIDEETSIAIFSFKYPQMYQRLFEAGISKIDSNFENLMKADVAVILITSGRLSYVDTRPYLDTIVRLLTSKHTIHREIAIDVITESFKDGRITVCDLSNSFKNLFRDTTKGFKYFSESIDFLCQYESFYENLIILSIEEFLGESDEKSIPKTFSQILDIYYELLSRNKKVIESKKALDFVTKLSKIKNKTNIKAKANLLIKLEKTINSHPLVVDILSDLLFDLVQ